MKIKEHQMIFKHSISLAFVLISTHATFPMEEYHIATQKEINPHNQYTDTFKPQEAFKMNIPWKKVVPEITLTPHQTIIITREGEIETLKLGPSFEQPKPFFELSRVKHPMIAVAQNKGDQQLLMVAAGNYRHQHTKQHVAKYRIFRNGQAGEPIKLDYPINGIWLHHKGTILVIASHSRTMIKNLENNSFDLLLSKGNWIADVAINQDGTKILLAENQGIIKLCSVRNLLSYNAATLTEVKNTTVSIEKQVDTGDIIEKIKLSDSEESILYVTPNGKVKKINMYHFLENSSVDLPHRTIQTAPSKLQHLTPQKDTLATQLETHDLSSVEGGDVKSSIFSYSPHSTSVALDQGSDFCTAHWTKSGTPEECNRIEMYRQNGELLEKFILTIPALEKTYNYITKSGQRKIGIGHIVWVSLCGNRLVALCTDGKIYPWMLPDKKHPCSETMQSQETLNPNQPERQRRRRSRTYSGGEKLSEELSWMVDYNKMSTLAKLSEEPELVSPKEEIVSKRKGSSSSMNKPKRVTTSPRIPGVFRKNPGPKKENSSPISLPKSKPGSPPHSPRRNESENKESDISESSHRGRGREKK